MCARTTGGPEQQRDHGHERGPDRRGTRGAHTVHEASSSRAAGFSTPSSQRRVPPESLCARLRRHAPPNAQFTAIDARYRVRRSPPIPRFAARDVRRGGRSRVGRADATPPHRWPRTRPRSGEPHVRAADALRNIVEAAPSGRSASRWRHRQARSARQRRLSAATVRRYTARRIAAPRDARRATSPLRADRRTPQPARRRQAAHRGAHRTPGERLGSASKTSPVKHCAPRFPAGRAS